MLATSAASSSAAAIAVAEQAQVEDHARVLQESLDTEKEKRCKLQERMLAVEKEQQAMEAQAQSAAEHNSDGERERTGLGEGSHGSCCARSPSQEKRGPMVSGEGSHGPCCARSPGPHDLMATAGKEQRVQAGKMICQIAPSLPQVQQILAIAASHGHDDLVDPLQAFLQQIRRMAMDIG